MQSIKTFEEYLGDARKSAVFESGVNIISQNQLGVVVKYIGGADNEFKLTTPSGMVRQFYGDEFYTMTTSLEEINRLKQLTTDILSSISASDLNTKYSIITKASARDLFQSENGFFDDIEEEFLSKDKDMSRTELKTLSTSPEQYLSGKVAPDALPTLSQYLEEYLEDVLFYITGKISAFLWWIKTNSSRYNNMSAQTLFSVYNKKILHAARGSGWTVSDAIDSESERAAIPGKSVYVLWTVTKKHWPDSERKQEIHIGAIIDPDELIRIHGNSPGELMISLFTEAGEPMKGYDDIRLKDLGVVLRSEPNIETSEMYIYGLFDSVRIDEGLFQGLKNIAGKILGFLSGKNKRIKDLGTKYLAALVSQVDDTIELEMALQKIVTKFGSTKAAEESIEYRKLKEKLGITRSSHSRKIGTITQRLSELSLRSDVLRKQVDKVKEESEKYAEEHKRKKLAEKL